MQSYTTWESRGRVSSSFYANFNFWTAINRQLLSSTGWCKMFLWCWAWISTPTSDFILVSYFPFSTRWKCAEDWMNYTKQMQLKYVTPTKREQHRRTQQQMCVRKSIFQVVNTLVVSPSCIFFALGLWNCGILWGWGRTKNCPFMFKISSHFEVKVIFLFHN